MQRGRQAPSTWLLPYSLTEDTENIICSRLCHKHTLFEENLHLYMSQSLYVNQYLSLRKDLPINKCSMSTDKVSHLKM